MTPDQLHVLQHALGADQYGRVGERNSFVASLGSDDWRTCLELTNEGLMYNHGHREVFQGECFTVTAQGKIAMRAACPKPPKLSRSQQRYRRWRAADCGLSFIEWLQLEKSA